jgi:CubicO group peptidase (beta-lactamase class C family)
MTATGFHPRGRSRPNRRTTSRRRDGQAAADVRCHRETQIPVGRGMVSTAGDYLRLAEMVRHSGVLGNTRLLSAATVRLMTSNALKPGIGHVWWAPYIDVGPTPAMGQGFGLGFAVRTEDRGNPLPGSVGSFYWSSSSGADFYVDPKQQLVIITMLQVPLLTSNSYRHKVRYLAYQAMTTLE